MKIGKLEIDGTLKLLLSAGATSCKDTTVALISENESEMASAMSEGEGRVTAAMPCDSNGGGYSEGES